MTPMYCMGFCGTIWDINNDGTNRYMRNEQFCWVGTCNLDEINPGNLVLCDTCYRMLTR
jgi:hypothetical protein